MKLKFCGGAEAVTGVNYLFQTEKTKFIIDCGMFQGTRKLEKQNYNDFPYNPKEVNFAIISHSHIDHIGRLPKLVKEGFAGPIYATPPTVDFARLLLEDSQRLLEEKAYKAGVIPLITQKDIEQVMSLFQPTEYGQEIKAASDVSFTFYDAGHILGSCITKISVFEDGQEKVIVHSGDLGNHPVPILRAPAVLDKADYILIESTYGDRNHVESPDESKDLLEDVIEETISRGGVLMIPSFAVERTQQLLYQLNELVENKRIPQIPIFIDSPLAIKITRVYKKYEKYFDPKADALIRSGDDVFNFPGLQFTEKTAQSKEINNVTPPKVILAGSGMSQGGRIIHHEKRYLPDPKSTLLVVSYQAEGTLGRQIVEGKKSIKIFDEEVAVRAQIRQIESYSAHADQTALLTWLSYFKKPIRKIFAVQGEQQAAQSLATRVRDDLGINCSVPKYEDEIQL